MALSQTAGRKERYPVPDLARGLAVLFMILVHLTDYFARPEIFEDSLFGKVSLFLGGPPAAVVFLVLMGYFVAASKKSPKALFLRGLMLLVGGIALNTGRSLHFLFRVWSGSSFFSPLDMIFNVDVLPFAGLTLMLLAGCTKFLAPNFIVYSLMSVAAAWLGQYTPATSHLDPYTEHALAFLLAEGYAWFPLFPWIAYPLLGIAFWSLKKRWPGAFDGNRRVLVAAGILGSVACYAIMPNALSVITTQEQMAYYHPDLPMFVWCVCFTVAWLVLLTFAQIRFGRLAVMRYLRWIGQQVTTIYVFQWLIIWNLAPLFFRSQGIPSILAWFVGILAVSCILTVVWREAQARFRNRPTLTDTKSGLAET